MNEVRTAMRHIVATSAVPVLTRMLHLPLLDLALFLLLVTPSIRSTHFTQICQAQACCLQTLQAIVARSAVAFDRALNSNLEAKWLSSGDSLPTWAGDMQFHQET